MKILKKYEEWEKLLVYECTLTDEQAKLFEEDEEKFFDKYGDELDFDYSYEDENRNNEQYELEDE